MNVLALNSGSSSLKFGFYSIHGGDDRHGLVQPAATHTLLSGAAASVPAVAQRLLDAGMPAVNAVGHRVVHGGPQLTEHCAINAAVLQQLEEATLFAPLHTPTTLAVMRAAHTHFPGLPHVACFDTRFHAGMPDVARVLPLPQALLKQGIRRYGFHGLSCESIVRQLGTAAPQRMVIAHLGNGASITAVQDGRSIDTSMGLTPTGGTIMGTRSGDLDPGLLVYLMRTLNLGAQGMEQLVDKQSGLLGISGLGSDMRQLRQAAPAHAGARLAIAMFCSAVCKQVAAMTTVLGGLDTLVFTGGIGENDAATRAAVCHGLAWFGVTLDDGRNGGAVATGVSGVSGVVDIAGADSRCAVQVLASQEDEQIAQHTAALLAG